tara:strand:- start:56 stop:1261 length:1206 start_codon:yes stop_codon:yes gene_type:complete
MSILTPQQVRNFSDRLSSRADLFQEAFIDSVFANLPQVFDATVLSINNPPDSVGTKIIIGDDVFVVLRVRPIGIHSFMYPNPFLASCTDITKKLINLHPQCIAKVIDSTEPNTGDVIECRRIQESNGSRAVLLSTIIKSRAPGVFDLSSARQSAQSAFLGQAPALVGAGEAKPAANSAQQASTVYTFDQYKDFANALMPLLDNIASHESAGAGYNAFNCGKADGGSSCESTVFAEFSGKLATKTIKQIRDSQAKRKKKTDRNGLFAVGRYQLITDTLTGAFNRLDGLTATSVYNKITQDALGAYLCLSGKRKYLHGYLIDKHDDAERAAHDLAEEWASYPSQYKYMRGNNQVTRGKSVYANDSAGNASRSGEKPEQIVDLMKSVKIAFLNNPKVKQILGIS